MSKLFTILTILLLVQFSNTAIAEPIELKCKCIELINTIKDNTSKKDCRVSKDKSVLILLDKVIKLTDQKEAPSAGEGRIYIDGELFSFALEEPSPEEWTNFDVFPSTYEFRYWKTYFDEKRQDRFAEKSIRFSINRITLDATLIESFFSSYVKVETTLACEMVSGI